MFRFGLSKDGLSFKASKFSGLKQSKEDFKKTDSLKVAVFLDVETTGLNYNFEEIIEVAARKVYFDKASRKIIGVGKSFNELREPSKPLRPKIIKLCGFTDEDLKGKVIDWDDFDNFISEADILISHNAYFDRPFIEKYSKVSPSKIWGCSIFNIDWDRWFTSSKLDYLAICHAFFFDSHRALNDVDALIHLLSFNVPKSDSKSYFYILLENARIPNYLILAKNTSLQSKDILKNRHYRWNGKIWQKLIPERELEEEKEFLSKNVYSEKGFLGEFKKIPLRDNFKATNSIC